jgi:hypothetical protein
MLTVVDEARDLALDGHAVWSESFYEVSMQVTGAFSNARVRRHGRAYALGLLSQAERKNYRQLAEFAGCGARRDAAAAELFAAGRGRCPGRPGPLCRA